MALSCHIKHSFPQKEGVTDGHLLVYHLLSPPRQPLAVFLSLSFSTVFAITVNPVHFAQKLAFRGHSVWMCSAGLTHGLHEFDFSVLAL